MLQVFGIRVQGVELSRVRDPVKSQNQRPGEAGFPLTVKCTASCEISFKIHSVNYPSQPQPPVNIWDGTPPLLCFKSS
jgi:hypothetical protein